MRIAIRDTTDSHTVGFFDNKAGIKFKSAEMTQFLKGACSFVTIKYNSKDIDKIGAGCKLAFRYKDKDFWLTINEFNKKGYETEITAYSLNLEANKEKRGDYKATKAMSIAEYFAVFDPEKSLAIGINEVSDKKLTLDWTGTDTVLARLYSIANSFDAELEFVTELNDDYSLKRHVVNIYKIGNLGKDTSGKPIRVGKELKILGFTSNIDGIYTALDARGKDNLKLPNKTIKAPDGQIQYFSKGGILFAPKARDKFPSNKANSGDGYILGEIKTTDYSDQEKLFGYALSELKKHCDVQVEYATEGAIDGTVGDTKTLVDSVNCEPALYVQARITEQTEDLQTGKILKTTFSNFKRTSSQISEDLTKRIEELAKNAVPYRIAMITSNGTMFKNGTGQSIVSPKLFKGEVEIADATYRFSLNNNTVAGLSYKVDASAVSNTAVLKIDGYVGNDAVVSDELTFINVNDGVNGSNGRGITSTEDYYLVSANKTGITSVSTGWVKGTPQAATATNKYHWHYHVDIYSDGTRKETVPAIIGIYGDKGADGLTSYLHTAYANKSKDIFADLMSSFAKPIGYLEASVSSIQENGAYKITTTGGTHVLKTFVGVSGTSGKNLWSVVRLKNNHKTNNLRLVFNGIGDGTVLNGSFPTIIIKPEEEYSFIRPGVARSSYDFIQITFQSDAPEKDLAFTVYEACFYNSAPFVDFSTIPLDQNYTGTYSDNVSDASNDITKYNWYLTKGQAGTDGKSPWFAYANSSDGKIDFSTTDGSNRRYIGTYIGYTRSNLYSDYTWTDVTANTKIGNRNLLLNTKTLSSNISSFANSDDVYSGGAVAKTIATAGSYKDTFRQKMSIVPDELEYIASFYAKSSAANHNMTCYFYAPSTTIKSISSQGIVNDKPAGADGSINIAVTNEWKRYWIKWTLRAPKDDTEKVPKEVIIGRTWDSVNTLEIALPALYAGNVNTEWSQAPEDLQASIDTKAEQEYTDAQMLALEERTALARENAIAEAMQNTISEVEAKWKLWYETNTTDEKQKVANDIATLFDRTAEFNQLLGEATAKFSFINNETLIGEEGIAIGDKDGKAKLFLSNDSISFVTNGIAQMTLTGDTLTIKNGLFTERIQIGNFVEEVYDRNPLFNVIRAIRNS
ncbi:hypothetical protein [Streptococcus porcinus]